MTNWSHVTLFRFSDLCFVGALLPCWWLDLGFQSNSFWTDVLPFWFTIDWTDSDWSFAWWDRFLMGTSLYIACVSPQLHQDVISYDLLYPLICNPSWVGDYNALWFLIEYQEQTFSSWKKRSHRPIGVSLNYNLKNILLWIYKFAN